MECIESIDLEVSRVLTASSAVLGILMSVMAGCDGISYVLLSRQCECCSGHGCDGQGTKWLV